jgi:hypothetical protein
MAQVSEPEVVVRAVYDELRIAELVQAEGSGVLITLVAQRLVAYMVPNHDTPGRSAAQACVRAVRPEISRDAASG